MYSERFLDHVTRPRGQGTLPGATHCGEAAEQACGDRLWLDLIVDGGIVREARFRVQGCPGAIAVGSALADLLPGRAAAQGSVTAAELEAALGGVPPAKRHALRLAVDALRSAIGIGLDSPSASD